MPPCFIRTQGRLCVYVMVTWGQATITIETVIAGTAYLVEGLMVTDAEIAKALDGRLGEMSPALTAIHFIIPNTNI